jgi:hypothetical protein
MRWFVRWYGANPLHLLALVGSFALAWYAGADLLQGKPVGVAVWFIGAVVGHDLILMPLYALADTSVMAVFRHRPPKLPTVPWINYLRVPVVLSGLLLLMWFPLIFRIPSHFPRTTDLSLDPYLGHWLAVTGALFLLSATALALRLGLRLGLGTGRGTRQAPRHGGQVDGLPPHVAPGYPAPPLYPEQSRYPEPARYPDEQPWYPDEQPRYPERQRYTGEQPRYPQPPHYPDQPPHYPDQQPRYPQRQRYPDEQPGYPERPFYPERPRYFERPPYPEQPRDGRNEPNSAPSPWDRGE